MLMVAFFPPMPRYMIDKEGCSSRPALPVSCAYSSRLVGIPQWITLRMSGQSMPIPKAVVQITMRRLPGNENDFNTSSFLSRWFSFLNEVSIEE